MDIITGYLIGFFCFCAGWITHAALNVANGNRHEQQQDDIAQGEALRNQTNRKTAA